MSRGTRSSSSSVPPPCYPSLPHEISTEIHDFRICVRVELNGFVKPVRFLMVDISHTWNPMDEDMVSVDPIEFHSEEEPYKDRIDSYHRKTGLTEAVQTGIGQLNGIPVAIGVMSPRCSISCARHSHSHDHDRFPEVVVQANDFILPINPISCSDCTAVEVIGSTLYFIGGEHDEVSSSIIKWRPDPSLSPCTCRDDPSHCSSFSGPNWKLCGTLVFPRFCPSLVVAGGKIFIFGASPRAEGVDESFRFIEVFDPENGNCFTIPNPDDTFERLHHKPFLIAPLHGNEGDKILLVSLHPRYPIQRLYDTNTNKWVDYEEDDLDLYGMLSGIGSNVEQRKEDYTLYWFRKEDFGKIFCYEWANSSFWEGPVVGLDHERPFNYLAGTDISLLHLHEDLFSLIWCEAIWTSDYCFTKIHFTILKVYKDIPSCSLIANVVACSSYIVDGSVSIDRAYLFYVPRLFML